MLQLSRSPWVLLSWLVIFLFTAITLCGCITSSGPDKGQLPPTGYHETSKNVELAPSILNPLTFNNGNFSIIVDSDIFFDRYSQYSKTYWDQSAVQNTITEIKNIHEKGGSIPVHTNSWERPQLVVVDEVLLILIAEGKARIYNEGNDEFIQRVLVTDYSMICGPTCGNGGQKITTEDKIIIFDQKLWVS